MMNTTHALKKEKPQFQLVAEALLPYIDAAEERKIYIDYVCTFTYQYRLLLS